MKRSKHSLSHHKLLTGDMGELLPCSLVEVLPGDTMQQATSALVRLSPMLAPVMHRINIRIHHWFVPHRLVWEDWEDFITGGPDNEDESVFPTITMPDVTGAEVGSLADYLGVPTGVPNLVVSALPFRAYALIWNEWYRDQDLQDELVVDETSGPDTTTSTALQNVAWEKDYFTSARPWPQKGPEITLPLGTTAPVVGTGQPFTIDGLTFQNRTLISGASNAVGINGAGVTGSESLRFGTDNTTGLVTDLSDASAVSINVLREALALQRFAEARARFGSRYTEYLRYLGVNSSDARLQRPEYLGGGRHLMQISEVLQTGVTTDGDDTEGVGNLKGHGIGAVRSNRYRRFFEEHGYVLSFISVLPKTMYMQGLQRTWNRRTKEDFWQPELQFIGQQEVLNKELYAAHGTPDGVFGYQDRYDDYRRMESSVSGEFRTTELDFWHMARIFGTAPALNEDFVKSNPTKRINAVQTEDVLWMMTSHSIQARRKLVKSGAYSKTF